MKEIEKTTLGEAIVHLSRTVDIVAQEEVCGFCGRSWRCGWRCPHGGQSGHSENGLPCPGNTRFRFDASRLADLEQISSQRSNKSRHNRAHQTPSTRTRATIG